MDDFYTFYGQLFGLYQQSQYAEALALAERAFEQYPDNAPMLYHFCACMAGKLNDKTRALAALTKGLDNGSWYPEPYWTDDDLIVLRGDPEFERLKGISLARAAEAAKTARPEYKVVVPDDKAGLPLLMALHGNNGNIPQSEDYWLPATHHQWILALLQSSQIAGPNSFIWNDTAIADRELTDFYQHLCANYTPDTNRVVLGGFSMGGETVIRAALQGVIPVRGFIAVTPGGDLTREVERWQPIIEAARGKKLRGAIIVGGVDASAPQNYRMVEMLNAGGIECKLLDYPEMAHTFPPDFAERLSELLAFITAD